MASQHKQGLLTQPHRQQEQHGQQQQQGREWQRRALRKLPMATRGHGEGSMERVAVMKIRRKQGEGWQAGISMGQS
eukprot:332887-Pelagomonas_calceolata.AAC.3